MKHGIESVEHEDLSSGVEDEDILVVICRAGAVESVLIALVVEAQIEGVVFGRPF